MAMKLSLVIPTYNRRASIERLLHAVSGQNFPQEDCEVIVVMDGSEDGTRELLEQVSLPFTFRSIWQQNKGRAAACNTGICSAQSELIVLLDDDMEPSPGFLSAHWMAHQAGTELGVLGAVPVLTDQSSPPVMQYIRGRFEQHLKKLGQPGYKIKVRDFYSGNFSIPRDVLLQAGLFDEEFKIYGNEDLELFIRLINSGVQLVYSPEALAYQHYEKDFESLARDEVAKGKTANLFIQKHPEAYSEVRISTYRQGSKKWRLARASLLWLSKIWPGMPDQVMREIAWLENRRPSRMNLYYRFALDYFFWLGVEFGRDHPVLYR